MKLVKFCKIREIDRMYVCNFIDSPKGCKSWNLSYHTFFDRMLQNSLVRTCIHWSYRVRMFVLISLFALSYKYTHTARWKFSFRKRILNHVVPFNTVAGLRRWTKIINTEKKTIIETKILLNLVSSTRFHFRPTWQVSQSFSFISHTFLFPLVRLLLWIS